MKKKCANCGVMKSPNQFHKQSSHPDGLHYSCKVCRSELRKPLTKAYRERHKDELKAKYDPEKRKKYYGRYPKTQSAYAAKEREKRPEIRRARNKLNDEIRAGRIIRQACEMCGDVPNNSQAHHEDYSKPLDVRWLCQPCHRKTHQRLKNK